MGSVGKKVPSVAERPGRPNWKSMAGEQVPNSPAVELARGERGIDAAEAVAAANKARSILVCILIKIDVKTGQPVGKNYVQECRSSQNSGNDCVE